MGWFGVINEGRAGLVILPVWLISAVSLVWALVNPKRLLTSKPNALMMLTMGVICFWYAGMPLSPEFHPLVAMWKSLQGGLDRSSLSEAALALYFFTVPLAPCMNLLLLLIHVWQRRQLTGRVWPFGLAWLGGLAVTVSVKIAAAMAHYESLPDEPPPGCFVVSAASRGHRRFVGSVDDAASGLPVNRQLARLRGFEA